MDKKYSVLFILRSFIIFLAPFLVLGLLTGAFWLCLALGLIVLMAWHYHHQLKLIRWLWQSRTLLPPSAPGSWSYIFDGIYRTQRRSQKRRRDLARLLRRFREASEAIPDAAIVFKSDGSLLWCNKLAQFYFGLKWPGDSGIRLSNLVRDPDFVRYIQQAEFGDDITIESPVRDDLELEIRVMPYSEDQYLLIARDVTQLKQLEQMRKDFVANVSHELKTPLTVIQGYLEMLEDPANVPAPMLQKAVADMGAQSQRMRNLVDQLLALSRMESPAQDLFELTINVPHLLSNIETEMQQLNQDKQHELTFSVAPISMHGRESEIRSAMINLVANAIDYTAPGGKIQVTWRPVGDQMEFSVKDNGPGIANEHQHRLTERFYRVDDDRNSAKGGTGLGLAIVKQALDHHHCHLHIDSVYGRGSHFYFRVPGELVVQQPGSARQRMRHSNV
ncbi:two-component system, OmpR family, phosphate regulon sensor histidine kinase PhoR [Pseudidiomarina planktonica]|uniref:histidine kinase n=1 Tax=Pseudidiomarina planktonica TaxID=1323738 RepID=A0A1Y6G496_9GAMM|nr:phosphate regulon sensor histidine kinase PhoR [Pseudidiomarina planktonica]RUO63317.1 two-component system sensor histidine kinase PhoR [Pseudidiomarina planktonica]SMQ80462.1 two-component system, OmpR family, phosphate regulon sensor histidine kinase PhoR [Pseudidiomarina planktonica]